MNSLESSMSPQESPSPKAQGLSALMDGQASAAEVKALCEAWGQDEGLQQDWQLYHLIGDTLRSDELAQQPGHDARFLSRLSAQLALEPVVLAPQAAAAPAAAVQVRKRARWAAPMTVAAGFMVVAGALVVLQGKGMWEHGAEATLAQAGNPGGRAIAASSLAATPQPDVGFVAVGGPVNALVQSYPANQQLVRDARLDRYLQAHKEIGAGTALGVSTGYLRNASYDTPQP
ncbi:RseA-like anti sigma(E) protein [Roseateles toxinivorans]|uniref:RseA-like anti sigma(E) protein n=2 Tax=Roseateles toxinivorans TaxID=270368 RepID=A0A4R6QQC7_9BURK|nr:RseA-like anti sigma(E) protein [Roseateles toxinivorans]